MKSFRLCLYTLCTAIVACILPTTHADESKDPAVLVIVLDGLRPDYITKDLMPNLHKLAKQGVLGKNHTAVIPTVTRVNSSSIATGAYPCTHGILGNTIYIPEVEPTKGLTTSNYKNLMKIDETLDGQLMTAISMGEHLEKAGKEIFVVSSGSTGSAFLLNHKVKGRGIINVEMILPESRREAVLATLGPVPEDASPNNGRNAWAVNAFFMELEENGLPDLTYMWLSDPDHTAHKYGIGTPETNRALKLVDKQIGRIVKKRTSEGLEERLNILVTADHGFSTAIGGIKLNEILKEHGLDKGVINVANGLYVTTDDEEQKLKIIEVLKKEPTIGPIFSRLGHGTLSPSSIHWNHERNPDIWVTANWNDDKNEYGYAGSTMTGGTAGHGSLSQYDISIPFIANGPAIDTSKSTCHSMTNNTDIAPTACKILGIGPSISMDGRIIGSILKDPNVQKQYSSSASWSSTPQKYPEYIATIKRIDIFTQKPGDNYKYILFGTASRSGKPDFRNTQN